MSKILIHLTTGPENPTRAALGFLVAKAAQEEGHEVALFLAGDAVQLVRDPVLDSLAGLGTGRLRESYDAVVAGGGRVYLSGMSSQARGVNGDELDGKPAEMAMPNRLVQLALDADRVLTYLVVRPATSAGFWPAITRRHEPPSLATKATSLGHERVRPLARCSRPIIPADVAGRTTGGVMAKLINCECGYVVRGETDDELVERANEHVNRDHPELVGKISREDFLAMAEEA